MPEIPYTVLIEAQDNTLLDPVLTALGRVGVSIHTLDELPDATRPTSQLDVTAKDVGYYSAIGATAEQIGERHIHNNYHVGIAKSEKDITVTGVKQWLSHIETLGTVSDPKNLGMFTLDALHPLFLAEARLHRIRQRRAA